ncbi:hypothetical protein D3C73_1161520 [compost metagenome]
MAEAVQITYTVTFNTQHFRIFLRHPSRTRAARSRQEGINAVLGKRIQHLVQPFEREYAFIRLEGYPGENTNGHHIAACQLHQTDIFAEHFRVFQPLLRVIVGTVQHYWRLAADCRKF